MTPAFRIAVPLFMVLAGSVSTPAGDPWWKAHLALLAADGAAWRTSNAAYQRDNPGEPPAYLMRYLPGLGETAVTGCLWGEEPGKVPLHFWDFFLAWNPADSGLTVWQSSGNGTVGIGREWSSGETTSEMDQTFTPPSGASWRVRHVTTTVHRDTLLTETFQWTDTGWQAGRSYWWARSPVPAGAPC